jgi:hypothetical protein
VAQLSPFHTPQEMQQISNLAHWIEGALLGAAALVALSQARTQPETQTRARAEPSARAGRVRARYAWPSLVLIAGVALLAYLLLPHHGLANAREQWVFIFGDPQQRQHVVVAALAIAGGGAELLFRAGRVRSAAWQLVWPAAVTAVGLMFATHTQHGTDEAVRRAARTHQVLGVLLVATGVLRVAELAGGDWLAFSWALTLLGASVVLAFYREPEGAYQPGAGAPHTGHATPSDSGSTARPAAGQHAETWDVAAVEARLRAAGLSPVRDREPVRQPFMSVPGTLLRLDTSDLQVFVYRNARAAALDVRPLDTVRVAPPTMMIGWRARPSLLTVGNVALIVITNDEALRRQVREALLGGR